MITVFTSINNFFIESDQFKFDGICTSVGFLGLFTSKQTPAFFLVVICIRGKY